MCACIYLYTFRNIYLYATGFSDAICNINKYIQIYYIPSSHQEVEYCPAPGFVQTPDHWWCTGDERVWRRNWRTLRPLCSETAPSHTDLWVQPQQEPNICKLILKKKKKNKDVKVPFQYLSFVCRARRQRRRGAVWLDRPTTGWAAGTSTAEPMFLQWVWELK